MGTGENPLGPLNVTLKQDTAEKVTIRPRKSPPPENFDNSPTRLPKRASLKKITDEKIRSLQFKKIKE